MAAFTPQIQNWILAIEGWWSDHTLATFRAYIKPGGLVEDFISELPGAGPAADTSQTMAN